MTDQIDQLDRPARQPLEIPEAWIAEAVELYGEEGAQSLVAGLKIYGEYSPEAFDADIGVRLEAATKTAEFQEAVIQGLIKTLEAKYMSKQGLLKEDPLIINAKYQGHLQRLHPEIFSNAKELLAGYFAEEIHARSMAYLMALVLAKEPQYRKRNQDELKALKNFERKLTRMMEVQDQLRRIKVAFLAVDLEKERAALMADISKSPFCEVTPLPDGTSEIRINSKRIFGEELFTILDDSEFAARAAKGDPVTERYLESLRVMFLFAKERWIPFLNENAFKNTEQTSAQKMKEENDRVFKLFKEEEKREISMCTAEDNRLIKGKRLVIQLSPITVQQGGIYGRFVVQINYHDEAESGKIVHDRQAQAAFMATREAISPAMNIIHERNVGQFPGVHLNRHTGEIEGLGIHSEGLKMLAKDQKAYEAIRRDTLFFLAHLTCSPVTLAKMFGRSQKPVISAKQITGPQAKLEIEIKIIGTAEGDSTKKESDIRTRRYPYGDIKDPVQRADIVFRILHGEQILYKVGEQELESETPMTVAEIRTAIENLYQSLTGDAAVSHRRLLPLIKSEEEGTTEVVVMGCFNPTDEARELARQHGRILRRGIEFPEMGQVFYPEDLDALFAKFGVKTLEEIVAMFPGKAFIRHETWVVPGRTKTPTETTPEESASDAEVPTVQTKTAKAIVAQLPRTPQQ
jgi:hypothetical protein